MVPNCQVLRPGAPNPLLHTPLGTQTSLKTPAFTYNKGNKNNSRSTRPRVLNTKISQLIPASHTALHLYEYMLGLIRFPFITN